MPKDFVAVLGSPEGREIVRRFCRSQGVRLRVFQELIEAEMAQVGKLRKIGLWENFDDILDRVDRPED